MYCWSLTWRILSMTFLACEIMQFCGSLKVLWHCPSLELEWKLFFSVLWPLLNFQICWHVERSSLTASSFRIWNNSAVIPSPPLALSVVMLPKAHLTLHCTFPNTAQEAVIKTIPKKKKCKMQNGKMIVWGGLTNSFEKKRSEKQRRKGNIYPSECRVPKNSKEK